MRKLVIPALVVLVGAAWVGADDSHPAPPAIDDPRFDFLKRLVGTWSGPSHDESMPQETFEFRLTAGGTAIEEREMIGSPMEMLTVYHMDGKDLVGTHYCILGNQPRVVAARRVEDDTLAFACSGKPGNSGSHDQEHVHGWTMRLDGEGKLHYAAELVKDGNVTEAPSMVLTRQEQTASR